MIVVTGIRISIDEPVEAALERAVRELGADPDAVEERFVIKASVDARRRGHMSLVYSVGLRLREGLDEEQAAARAGKPSVTVRKNQRPRLVFGREPLEHRPVIAGFGPAGMFAGLLLARHGYRPLILERGADVDARVKAVEGFWQGRGLDTATNVQFGEGGAGTFSDGKLTTRIGDPRCEWVLGEFVRFGAPKEILYKAKPHIGTDLLRDVVRAIREEITAQGGEVRFLSRLEDLRLGPRGLERITAGGQELPADVLVLAPGHSARDTFSMLMEKQFAIQVKPFSVGARIEHLQKDIDRALFGEFAGHPALGRGEYQLSYRRGDRAVYTFCMCPGGIVVPAASQQGGVVVNGMSEFARDRQNANSALVVSVNSADFGGSPQEAIAFQQGLEQAAFRMGGGDYQAPAQTAGEFLQGRPGLSLGRVTPSYSVGVRGGRLDQLFPQQVTQFMRLGLQVFDGRLKGFGAKDAVLTGVETRTSSPIRILREEDGQAVGVPGVYPCGEGAGYAGGIMSAAVDGIRIAESIMARYQRG